MCNTLWDCAPYKRIELALFPANIRYSASSPGYDRGRAGVSTGGTMQKLHIALSTASTAALLAGFSVQSVIAADLGVNAPPPPAPIVSRWDGLYASFSAGGTWTKVEESLTETSFQHSEESQFFNPPPDTLSLRAISDQTFNTVSSQSGKQTGAVFTFALGYNIVWSGWLAGIQSEVSLNRNNIRLVGTSLNTVNGVGSIYNPNNQPLLTTFNISGTNTSTVYNNLENKWTISEMARLGFLVRPDWLVYGLVGWSWGGFDYSSLNQNQNGAPSSLVFTTPFTLSGFTYGAGVEKEFGWLRAFVQYKGINYDTKGIDSSAPFSSSNQPNPNQGINTASSQNATESAVRRFSVDVQQITAGVTIPINFNRW